MKTTKAQSFTTPTPIRLDIKIPTGDIELTTSDSGASVVRIDAEQKLLDEMRIELVGSHLSIEWRRKSLFNGWMHQDGSLSIRVELPHHSRIKISNVSGETTLNGEYGDVTVNTVSGNVRLPQVVGDVTVKSVSGILKADSIDGSVSVKSVSGDISVERLYGGRVEVQNVSGDVRLGVAEGINLDIDATSSSGEVSSELPLSDVPAGDGAEGPTLIVRSRTVSGDFRVVRAA
jgi:putative adhesin